MANVGNWVGEVTTTLGQGDLTLGGAIEGFTTFSSAVPNGLVWYVLVEGKNKEAGKGTLAGSTLKRTTVYSSLIDGVFSDISPPKLNLLGVANVFCTFNKTAFDEIQSDINNSLHLSGGNNEMAQPIDMGLNRVKFLGESIALDDAMPYHQISDLINLRLEGVIPSGDIDFGRVSEAITTLDDYRLVTEAVSQEIDYGSV